MNEQQQTLWEFMQQQSDKLAAQTLQHIGLTFISLVYSGINWITAGYFYYPQKAIFGHHFRHCGGIANHPQHSLA